MSKNAAIEIFLRVRPTKRPFNGLSNISKWVISLIIKLDLRAEDKKIDIHVPKDAGQGYVNNQKENHTFMFDNIFGMEAKQQDIFDNVAKDVNWFLKIVFHRFSGCWFCFGRI